VYFRVPVLLAKKTTTLVPVFIVTLLTNVTANVLLVPRFGPPGAVWPGVLTVFLFSFFG